MLIIDEIPQLLNVWSGGMRWVEPRPEVEKIICSYNPEPTKVLKLFPVYRLYLSFEVIYLIPPYWDDRGEDSEEYNLNVIMPKKNAHTLYGRENQSCWLDLKILLSTAFL